MDTGLTRKTGPLVEIFKTKLREQSFENEIQQQLIPVNNKAIEQLLVEEYKKLKTSFRFISQFQYNHFQEMIPDFLKEKWEAGLKHEDYTLKLCGAGGGGFLLGMTEHFEQTQKDFSPLQISVLKI